MYATKDMPVYIGEAAKSTVKERLQDHRHSKRDFVIKWIKKNIPHRIPCWIKVGILFYKGVRFPYSPGILELLHDIQTLLILSETKRGNCPANVSNTKSRKWCRPGMVVVNRGFYRPLMKTYCDQLESIFSGLNFTRWDKPSIV
jgi:hypothetical protein